MSSESGARRTLEALGEASAVELEAAEAVAAGAFEA